MSSGTRRALDTHVCTELVFSNYVHVTTHTKIESQGPHSYSTGSEQSPLWDEKVRESVRLMNR